VQAMENFLLGRYHMYQSVYTHKKNIAIQKVYELFFNRILKLVEDGMSIAEKFPVLLSLKKNEKLTYKEFMSLDDTVF
jgi:HD superfamily phosphohydrolase